jgi:4a-hydroxytetrahydrobiopterin dehydratase
MKQETTWKERDDALYRLFKFNDFSQAFSFMVSVAIESEKLNHHPTWKNTWNIVEIWLSTHDAGDRVTEKDRHLSEKIDIILESYNT